MQPYRTATLELAEALKQGLSKANKVIYRGQVTGNLRLKLCGVEIILLRDAAAAYVIAAGVSYSETEASVLRPLREAFGQGRIVTRNESFRPSHGNAVPLPSAADRWVERIEKLAAHLRSL